MKFLKKFCPVFVAFIMILNVRPAGAAETFPQINGEAAYLLDIASGRVLYTKNENEKMFPASMTKLLTAMLILDYLSPSEYVTVGSEINSVPFDAVKAGHKVGETLVVKNLLRALLIRSGNDSACVAAKSVADKVNEEEEELSYAAAERLFTRMMNEKAKSLGALNSNFANPHGYHNPSHYTTAKDMALIAAEAIKYPLIAEICKEASFSGNGAGENPPEGAITANYKWDNTNLLLSKPEYFYQYATGLKTGFTNQAGYCLVASAENEGRTLISVILFSEEEMRWLDTVKLFEYGFNNYSIQTVQEPGEDAGTIYANNPRLGETGEVALQTKDFFSDLFSEEEFNRIKKETVYDEEVLYQYTEEEQSAPDFEYEAKLKTPVEEGQTVGVINYYLDGKLIFTGEIFSTNEVLERTFNSDVDYYIDAAKEAAFSGAAIPYWVGGVLLIVGIIHLAYWIKRRKKRKTFSLRDRY